MRVKNIFLGKWFKRIDIHITEFYNVLAKNRFTNVFMRDKNLRNEIIQKLGVKGFEYTTEKGEKELIIDCGSMKLIYPEDGSAFTEENVGKNLSTDEIIKKVGEHRDLLNNKFDHLLKKIHKLTLGRLTKTPFTIPEEDYLFIVLEKTTEKQVEDLFAKFGDEYTEKHFIPELEIYQGERLTVFVERKKVSITDYRIVIGFWTFLSGYNVSLSKLLNDQRKMREDILNLRKGKLTLKHIITKKDDLSRLINSIDQQEVHIKQMAEMWKFKMSVYDYYMRKEKLIKRILNELEVDMELKRVERNHAYVKNAWGSLRMYCNDTIELFDMTYSENQELELHMIEMLVVLEVSVGVVKFAHLGEKVHFADIFSISVITILLAIGGVGILILLIFHFLFRGYMKSIRNLKKDALAF